MVQCEDRFQIFWEFCSVFRKAVGDVCDEINEVAEGDYAGRGCGAGGGQEDVALRLVLAILIEKVFAV